MPAETAERAEARPAITATSDAPLSMGSAQMRELLEASTSSFRSTVDRKSDSAAVSLDLDASSLYDSFFSHATTAGAFRPARAEATLAADSSAARSEPFGRGVSRSDNIKVEPGDTLESIAEARLGEGSTTREREAFIRAVREINQIGKKDEPKVGDSLNLPTKNSAGNFVYEADSYKLTSFLHGGMFMDVKGITTTISPGGTRTTIKDGSRTLVTDTIAETSTLTDTATPHLRTIRKSDGTSELVEKDSEGESTTRSDGDGRFLSFNRTLQDSSLSMTRTRDGKGGLVDEHTGARPEQKFKLSESADGELQVTDGTSDKPQQFLKDASLTESRSELLALAAQRISDPLLLSKFKADMVRFENRAAEANLPPSEIKDTYSSLARILSNDTDAKTPIEQRTILAQQVIAQAARPSLIDQGGQITCGAAALENVVYSTHPGRAADMLAQVSLSGQFKSADGTIVKFPDGNLNPTGESLGIMPSGHTGDRSYASQLFQIAAVNSFTQSRDGKVYMQLPSVMHKGTMSAREGLVDRNGVESSFAGMWEADVIKAHEQITGVKRESLILGNSVARPDSAANSMGFENQESLVAKLEELRKSGNFPIIAMVHTSHEPFKKDAGKGIQEDAWHAVAISSFDPATGMVKIDNQWGSRSDRTISVAELFNASTGPRS